MSNDSKTEAWQAPDGTEWVYSPELALWNGWQPGEDGVWEWTPAEFSAAYPGVEWTVKS